MATLDLFKKRQPHIIYLEVDNQKQAFKLPTQYTVEEAERILEMQAEIDDIKQEVAAESEIEQLKQINRFWERVYMQALVLFNHYQPDITLDWLQANVSKENALEIIAFFTEQHVKNIEEDAAQTGKKKLTTKS